jgi:hypothetical protein
LEYDDLNNLEFEFKDPIKTDLNTYIASLNNPISFILPKSEILDIYQDNFGNNKFQYVIDVDEHQELLIFLENLDSLCINMASENSVKWFKKTLDAKTLIKHYINLYNLDDSDSDQIITADFEIGNTVLLDDLSNYNDDDANLLVSIEGIEFYKQTFKWKIVLESVLDRLTSDDEFETESDDEEVNFENIFASSNQKNRLSQNYLQKSESSACEKAKDDTLDIKFVLSLDELETKVDNKPIILEPDSKSETSNVINNDIINDLADMDIKSEVKREFLNNQKDLNNPESSNKESLFEIESKITQKRTEAKKLMMNAERAKRAAESLQRKALETTSEVKKYEERLKELSTTESFLNL